MTHAEQHEMILELRDYVHKMSRREQEEFEMFAKRDKDDEDLDIISRRKLQQMHETYATRRKRGT